MIGVRQSRGASNVPHPSSTMKMKRVGRRLMLTPNSWVTDTVFGRSREVDPFEMLYAPCGCRRRNIFVHDASHVVGQGEVLNLCCFECAGCHATWVASQAQASLVPSTWMPGLPSGQVTDEQVALLYGMDKELRRVLARLKAQLDHMSDQWWDQVAVALKEAGKWRLKREGALREAMVWKPEAKRPRILDERMSTLVRQPRKQKRK